MGSGSALGPTNDRNGTKVWLSPPVCPFAAASFSLVTWLSTDHALMVTSTWLHQHGSEASQYDFLSSILVLLSTVRL